MVKIEKIISLEILELRAENPPTIVVVCHYRLSFWSNSPTRPYGARNGPLRCTNFGLEAPVQHLQNEGRPQKALINCS